MPQMRFSLFLLLAMAALPPAFAAEESVPGENDALPPPVSSDRLRAIMESIRRSVETEMGAGASPGDIDREHITRLIEGIEELLYHSELMSADVAPQGIDTTDVVTFRALASQLYTEALNVRSLTDGKSSSDYELNLLDSAIERLYQTCAACHKLFRDTEASAGAPAP
jgi:hypothetical protein